MSCPFFLPTAPAPDLPFPHPERLPLGAAYSGHCTAANLSPTSDQLHGCNLGYAECAHLPAGRAADAVRFSIRRDPAGVLTIQYVCEAAHAPVEHGALRFDIRGLCREPHADPRIQRMAECCVQSHAK